MSRIPVLKRNAMDPDQRAVHDKIDAGKAPVGAGPAIGYAYSAEFWRLHNEASQYLLGCSLTGKQVRVVSLMTARHWKAAYPWASQAKRAMAAGLAPKIVEAINQGTAPDFGDPDDAAVYAVTRELLAGGTLSDKGFATAETALGYKRLVEIVGAIGHFCTTALMANLVGDTIPSDVPSRLKM
ncbi:MAG: hypothetical protein RIB59_09405 [Rhodospirillales bacterium]